MNYLAENSHPKDSPMVKAQSVSKIYSSGAIKVEALRGINLEVKTSEMIAIMGPSGCGKTTLLNCLSGLDDLTGGKVMIDGVDVHKMSDNKKSEFRAKKMGFIFQSYNLLPVLSALENVELPLVISHVDEKLARRKAIEALSLVGLEEWKNHRPSELSGGQQQRVAIARSLANSPSIIWADEPTGNLDSENSLEIISLLRKLNREVGLTLIVVTHDQAIASQTDRIVVMRNGQIVRTMDTSSTPSLSSPTELDGDYSNE